MSRSRQHIQFSLSMLFTITAIVAANMSAVAAGANLLGGVFLLLIATANVALLITGLIYGRGYGATFCIGALVPASLVLFGAFLKLMQAAAHPANDDPFGNEMRLVFSLALPSAFGIGLACVAFRHLLERGAVGRNPSGAAGRETPNDKVEDLQQDSP